MAKRVLITVSVIDVPNSGAPLAEIMSAVRGEACDWQFKGSVFPSILHAIDAIEKQARFIETGNRPQD